MEWIQGKNWHRQQGHERAILTASLSFTRNLGWVTINSSKIFVLVISQNCFAGYLTNWKQAIFLSISRVKIHPRHAKKILEAKTKQAKPRKIRTTCKFIISYDSLEERHVFGYKTTSTPSKNLTQVASLAFKFCSKQFFLSRYPLLLYLPFCFSHQISYFD